MRSEDQRLPGAGIPQALFSLTYHVERRIRCHFRGTNLHWGLRRILQRLWLQDGFSQKELADRVGSSEASVSNMLKHLVAGDWVERRQDSYDYRVSRVYLTKKAIALREKVTKELERINEAMHTELGEADTDLLEALLERMADLFHESSPGEERERFGSLADHPSPPGEL